jgi:hypothetical protein
MTFKNASDLGFAVGNIFGYLLTALLFVVSGASYDKESNLLIAFLTALVMGLCYGGFFSILFLRFVKFEDLIDKSFKDTVRQDV